MNMEDSHQSKPRSRRLEKFIREIYADETDLISDQRAEVLMLHCAQSLLSEEQVQQIYPELWRYLAAHPEIKLEFDLMMDLARDAAPEPVRPGLWDRLVETASLTLAGFRPLLLSPTRTAGQLEPGRMTASVSFADDLAVDFVLLSAGQTETGHILMAELTLPEGVTPTEVMLRLTMDVPFEIEAHPDAHGGVKFENLPAGEYTFEMGLRDRRYRINNILIG
jgi:hypothetical protein